MEFKILPGHRTGLDRRLHPYSTHRCRTRRATDQRDHRGRNRPFCQVFIYSVPADSEAIDRKAFARLPIPVRQDGRNVSRLDAEAV